MSIYDRFRRFLEERGCSEEFDKAFGTQNPGYVLTGALWDILGGDEYFIGRAFEWATTEQGRRFWSEIDREWQNQYQTIKQ